MKLGHLSISKARSRNRGAYQIFSVPRVSYQFAKYNNQFICTRYISPSHASLHSFFVYGAIFDNIAIIDLQIGLSSRGPLCISLYTLRNIKSAYVALPPAISGISSFTCMLQTALRFMASSLLLEIVSSMKMVRYIRFDFVGFFLLWSKRIRTPRRILELKSSLAVKSSKTCYEWDYGGLACLI